MFHTLSSGRNKEIGTRNILMNLKMGNVRLYIGKASITGIKQIMK